MLYNNLIQAIGNTPLVRIPFDAPARVYAKLEYLNPGGSLKDRTSLFMIEEAERNGILKPGGTIIEASSGNQGIAAAMIGAIKGYKVIITTNDKFSTEKINTIRAYGAQIIMCPATEFVEDPRSYHSQAVALHKATPNSFMLNQYYNLSNAKAHYHLLGPEIWRQTNGGLTHYIAAAGTGGTISGAGKFFKEQSESIKVIAVDAANSYRSTNGHPKPYKTEGIGVDFDSPVLNKAVIDEFFCITDDEALNMLKTLARQYGLLVGPSSGAVAYAALQYAKNLTENDTIVMVMGDSGRAYLTKNYYVDAQPAVEANPAVRPATARPEGSTF